MNPYSGLLELFEKKGVIEKQGNRLKYVTTAGEELLEYRKNWSGELLDMVMKDYLQKEASVVNTEDDDTVEIENHVEEPVIND